MTDHNTEETADDGTDHDLTEDAAEDAAENETVRAEWVAVGTYTNGLEADIVRNLLQEAGIPVFTKGEQPGIFGGGYGGNISGGIVLHVPSPEVERAKIVVGSQ